MKTKMMQMIAAALIALTCVLTPVASVLGVGLITPCGIYDGGGSGG
jgi:hypothetical protein